MNHIDGDIIKKLFLYDRFKACIKSSKMFYVIDTNGDLTPLGYILFFFFVAYACRGFFYDSAFVDEPYKYFLRDLNEYLKVDDDI